MPELTERSLLAAAFDVLERHTDRDGQRLLAALRKAVLADMRLVEMKSLRLDILRARGQAFACDPDESCVDDTGYDLRDPKHPSWPEALAVVWDGREGK